MKILMVGNYSQPFCSEVQWALTLEDMQHSVTRVQENTIVPGTLPGLVAGHDLFIWVRTWPGFVTHQDLDAIRVLGIPSVNYHLDLFIGLQRAEGLDTDPRWRCDYVVTPDGDPASAEIFKAKGINHHFIRPGAFKPACVDGNRREDLVNDLAFVGGGVEYGHKTEWPYRAKLVTWLQDTYGSRYSKFGHPQPTMRDQDLNDLCASVKVMVGDSLCPGFTKPFYATDRLYEFVGRGGFTIFPYIQGLEEEFTDGETIVFYRFGDFDELKRKIDYYIDPANADERERIRKAGQAFVREHATYHNRLRKMLDIVFPAGAAETAVTDQSASRILNLGAGLEARLHPDWTNVDVVAADGVDVVWNVMNFPWPFEESSADEVIATDLLEHLPTHDRDYNSTYIKFVEEAHRVLKPSGVLRIQTPRFDSPNLPIDLGHVKGFHERSMDYFDETTDLGKAYGYYSKARFSVTSTVSPNLNVTFHMIKQ